MVNTIFLLEKNESSEEEWVNKTIVNEEKHEKKSNQQKWDGSNPASQLIRGKNVSMVRITSISGCRITFQCVSHKTFEDIYSRIRQDIAQQGIHKPDNLIDIFKFQCLMVLAEEKNNCFSKYNISLTIPSNNVAITKGHDCN